MKIFIKGLYPGWRVMGGAFICAALAIGFSSYIFGLFVIPVAEEFGITRASVNNGAIVYLLGTGLMSLVAGKLLDRTSARMVIALGGLLFGGALMVISQSSSLWLMLVMLGGPLSFGMAACGILGANTVVARWFKNHRGRALGVLAISTSAGGFIATPLTAFLIENFGWRGALLQIGAAASLIVLLISVFMIRNRPTGTEHGYEHEFSKEGIANLDRDAQAQDGEEQSWSYTELLRNRNFWLLSIGIGLLFGSDQAIIASQVPYLQDAGYDLSSAALIASFMALSAIGGKVIVGALADRIDLRLIFYVVALAHVGLLTVYILQPDFWIMLVFVSIMGVAVGGVMPAWATIMAWLFGSRSYGTVMGLMIVLIQPFAVVALRFVGEVHDRTGSYAPAFAVFMGLVFVSMLLVSMLRPANSSVKVKGRAYAKQPA